jgi:hypothetical protein
LSNTANEASISCSKVRPCHDIYFDGMNHISSDGDSLIGSCRWHSSNTIHGLSNC